MFTNDIIIPGQVTADIDRVYYEFVQEILENAKEPDREDLVKMIRYCPVNSVAVGLKALRAIEAVGTYQHPDKDPLITPSGNVTTATDWVIDNFKNMRGSLRSLAKKMFRQCYPLGHSSGEIIVSSSDPRYPGEWRLHKVNVLDPCLYRYAGYRGEWDRIIFSSTRGEFVVPRKKLVHIDIPSIDEPESPLGDGQAIKAFPYYQARKKVWQVWSDKLARDAYGLLVLQGDSHETISLRDSLGNPSYGTDGLPRTRPMLRDLEEKAKRIKGGSYFVTDKRNTVNFHSGIGGTDTGFNTAVEAYKKDIFLAYGIPVTIFDEGSATLGQAGLNHGHRLILDVQSEEMIQAFQEELIDKIIHPLLVKNFGFRFLNEPGGFHTEKFMPPELAGTRVTNISTMMLQGIISSNDLEAINRVRVDCGISPISEEDYHRKSLLQLQEQEGEQGYWNDPNGKNLNGGDEKNLSPLKSNEEDS
jgi:hypothetical protein